MIFSIVRFLCSVAVTASSRLQLLHPVVDGLMIEVNNRIPPSGPSFGLPWSNVVDKRSSLDEDNVPRLEGEFTTQSRNDEIAASERSK